MARNRNWITREEIAEIHETLMTKIWKNHASTAADINRSSVHMQAADDLRATEKLGGPMGDRAA